MHSSFNFRAFASKSTPAIPNGEMTSAVVVSSSPGAFLLCGVFEDDDSKSAIGKEEEMMEGGRRW
jgi:hypothetical protein